MKVKRTSVNAIVSASCQHKMTLIAGHRYLRLKSLCKGSACLALISQKRYLSVSTVRHATMETFQFSLDYDSLDKHEHAVRELGHPH